MQMHASASLAPAARLRSCSRSATSRAPRRRCTSRSRPSARSSAALEQRSARACSTAARATSQPTAEGADFEAAARRVLAEFDSAIAGVHDRAARAPRPRLARAAAVARRRLAARRPRALPRELSRHHASTSPTCSRKPASSACTTMRADFALAAVRAETPELQADVVLRRRLPPRLPRRPSARRREGDQAARPRRVAVHPPVALEQRAPVPRRGVPSAGDGHGDGGRSAGDGDGHGSRRPRHQRRAGAGALSFPAARDRDPPGPPARAGARGSTSCAGATAACRWRRRRCTISCSRTGRPRKRRLPDRRATHRAASDGGRKLDLVQRPGDPDVRQPLDLAAHRRRDRRVARPPRRGAPPRRAARARGRHRQPLHDDACPAATASTSSCRSACTGRRRAPAT